MRPRQRRPGFGEFVRKARASLLSGSGAWGQVAMKEYQAGAWGRCMWVMWVLQEGEGVLVQ